MKPRSCPVFLLFYMTLEVEKETELQIKLTNYLTTRCSSHVEPPAVPTIAKCKEFFMLQCWIF